MCSPNCPGALMFEGLTANQCIFLCNFSRKEFNRVNTKISSQKNIAKVPQVNLLHLIYLLGEAQVCRHLAFGLLDSPHQQGSHFPLHIISPGMSTQSISEERALANPRSSQLVQQRRDGWILWCLVAHTPSPQVLSAGVVWDLGGSIHLFTFTKLPETQILSHQAEALQQIHNVLMVQGASHIQITSSDTWRQDLQMIKHLFQTNGLLQKPSR